MGPCKECHNFHCTCPKGTMIEINPHGNPLNLGWTAGMWVKVTRIDGNYAQLKLPKEPNWNISVTDANFKGKLKVGDELECNTWVNERKMWVVHRPASTSTSLPVPDEVITNKANNCQNHNVPAGVPHVVIKRTDNCEPHETDKYKSWWRYYIDADRYFFVRRDVDLPQPEVGDTIVISSDESGAWCKLRITKAKATPGISDTAPATAHFLITATPPVGKETVMKGSIFNGQVVRTSTVQAGEGVSAGKEVSEVLFTINGFIAANAAQAQLIVSAAAARDEKLKGVNFADPVSPVEVLVQQIA